MVAGLVVALSVGGAVIVNSLRHSPEPTNANLTGRAGPPVIAGGLRIRSDLPELALSGRMPLSVSVPTATSPENARPWFDQFSWQSFIALNWPVDPKRRGTPLEPDNPNIFQKPPAGSDTVWGSYKEAYELFGQEDKAPTPWDSYDIPVPVCDEKLRQKKLLLMANICPPQKCPARGGGINFGHAQIE